jgi:hypothetical protein
MNKADRAQTLLNDEWFQEEIESIRKSLISTLTNSNETDIDVRERCYLKLRVLDEIIGHFSSIASSDQLVKRRWKIL